MNPISSPLGVIGCIQLVACVWQEFQMKRYFPSGTRRFAGFTPATPPVAAPPSSPLTVRWDILAPLPARYKVQDLSSVTLSKEGETLLAHSRRNISARNVPLKPNLQTNTRPRHAQTTPFAHSHPFSISTQFPSRIASHHYAASSARDHACLSFFIRTAGPFSP